jgi:hypothetical protein
MVENLVIGGEPSGEHDIRQLPKHCKGGRVLENHLSIIAGYCKRSFTAPMYHILWNSLSQTDIVQQELADDCWKEIVCVGRFQLTIELMSMIHHSFRTSHAPNMLRGKAASVQHPLANQLEYHLTTRKLGPSLC